MYYHLIMLQAKARTEYRGAFILLCIAKVVGWGASFIMILLMLNRFDNIGGWTRYDLIFLQAMNMLAYALIAQFLNNPCGLLPQNIRTGTMDGILVKPVNPFFYYIFNLFSMGYVSMIILGAGLMLYVLPQVSFEPTAPNIIFLIISLIGAALIEGAIMLFAALPSFWVVKSNAVTLVSWQLKRFIDYPITIYNRFIQVLLTFVLPYAFISFFPAERILGIDSQSFPFWFAFLTLPIGFILIFIAYKLWFVGLKYYESTGS